LIKINILIINKYINIVVRNDKAKIRYDLLNKSKLPKDILKIVEAYISHN